MRASSAVASAARTGSSSTRESTSLEEAAHDQPLGLAAREPACHQVEELVAIDAAHGRAVRAAHVVRQDLETRDRNCMRRRRQHQVPVFLVGVRLLRVWLDADHSAPHGR
jgi:hypothetical protein